MIYPIANSEWVSPFQCVPRKVGIIVVPNTNNVLIPMRPVTGWRVCIDYIKLNELIEKDHFLYHSWTRCWIAWRVKVGTIFIMVVRAII